MTQEAVIAAAPMFGVLDITILVGAATFGIYWLVKKKFESPSQPPPEKTFKIETRLTSMRSDDRSFISKMKSQNRNIVVFYGSQTGTAEEFANRLAKEAARYGMKAMVADPEEYDMEELVKLGEIENSVAVFCMATYGEGDPTDNSIEFNEWLQNGEVDLSGVNYGVFGLGNKTYEHYNAMGKFVDKRIAELGGHRVVELGLGDDDANIEEDFVTWKEKFWPAVMDFFNLELKLQDVSMRQYKLVEPPSELPPEKIFTGEIARLRSFVNQRPPFDAKNPYIAKVKAWRELFKGGDRSCMHIEFDVSGSKLRYDSGDHIALYPVNDPELVQKFGDLLSFDLDVVFSLQNIDEDSTKKSPFPVPCTYRTALSHYVDITSCPRTHIFKEIADYATDPEEKEKLLLLASNNPEGKAFYQKFILDDCRSLLHVLEDFHSCKPPLDMICELLPRLQARFYSISSSPKLHPTDIHITAVHVKYSTPTGRINKGVATTWLSYKKPAEEVTHTVPCYVRKSQFRLPPRVQTPVIMIGPGTGIAPFRGFLQERSFLKSEGRPVGENILYFGCRKREHDFLYEEELTKYQEEGLLKLRVAFSREQQQKVYVQHLLKDDAKDVWRIIGQESGHLYVCGDAKNMARDVLDTLIWIIQTEGGLSDADARAYIKKMEGQRRYATDVWS